MKKDKPCSKCKTIYPIEHYFQNKDGTSKRSRCKPCRAEDQKAYYDSKRDEINSVRRIQWADRRGKIDSLKEVPCADCGIQYPPYVMDFDHVYGIKLFNIGNAVGKSFQEVLTEAEKCDIVCANCHRIRTHRKE
jgi:hypothetical protein